MEISFGDFVISLRVRRVEDKTKMVVSGSSIPVKLACENFSKYLKFTLELRPEKRQAVNALLQGSDVLAVLPTGFGKVPQ